MSNPRQDESDYPYAARCGTASVPATSDLVSSLRWRWVRRWLSRAAIAAGLLLLLIMIGGGILAYRAACQAWLIADLEQRGCNVSYWQQPPENQDSIFENLRERLGDRWWSEVREVSHDGTGYWDSLFSFHDLTEDDVSRICAGCRKLRKLQKFRIASNSFSCEQLARWPHLVRLEGLDVESAKLCDADLAVIGRMSALKSLKLGSGTFTNDGLAHLAPLPRLESLTLEKVQLRCAKPNEAPAFKPLRSLAVDRSPDFGDEAIACFGSLPNLEDLNFNRTPIGDRGLAHLLRGGQIRSLIVNEGQLTDMTMATLASYSAPRWLVLSGMPLTDEGLAALAGKQFPVLVLDHTAVTDESFRALNDISGIEYVSLANSKVTGIGVGLLNSDQVLEHLDVGGPALTPAGIQALSKARCKELGLSGANFGDKELMLFVNNDDLTRLYLPETQVSDDGFAAFYAARARRLSAAGREETLVIVRDPFGSEGTIPPVVIGAASDSPPMEPNIDSATP